MGFWTNNPSSAPKAKKPKGEPKPAKTEVAPQGSTWTQGRQTGAHVISILMLAAIVFESYKALPPGQGWLGAESVRGLALFGGTVFAAGLAIALFLNQTVRGIRLVSCQPW